MKDRRLRLMLDAYAMAHSFDMSDGLGKMLLVRMTDLSIIGSVVVASK